MKISISPIGSLLAILSAQVCSYETTGNATTDLASVTPFSSDFQQPAPPTINAAFRAHWNQHKWDVTLSHIASGFLYNSPSNKLVRVDVAYDMNFESSLFDYRNASADGTVPNKVYLLSPSIASKPQCSTSMVDSNFPLLSPDFLVSNNAVYLGTVKDEMNGVLSLWGIIYQGAIPVTLSLNSVNTVVAYEYFSPQQRTRVITKFFNIILGDVDSSVFGFPTC